MDTSLEGYLYRVELDDSEAEWSFYNSVDGEDGGEDAICEIIVEAGDKKGQGRLSALYGDDETIIEVLDLDLRVF